MGKTHGKQHPKLNRRGSCTRNHDAMNGLRLKTKTEIPPGEYAYTDPDTGHTSKGGTFHECVLLARKHRQENNLPVPDDFEAQVEHFICARLSPQWCAFEDNTIMIPTPDMSVDALIAGGRALLTLVVNSLNADSWVSPEEAERRAYTCARCPLNGNAEGCSPCRGLEAVASVTERLRNTRNTRQDKWLRYCMACGCSLKLIVWVSNKILDDGMTDEKRALIEQRAPHCWRIVNKS